MGVGDPISGLGREVPHLMSGWGGGCIPSQVWVGVPHPRSGWWGGTPSQVWMVGGDPIPGLDGGGTQGTPQPGLDGGGVPHPRSEWWRLPPLPHPLDRAA